MFVTPKHRLLSVTTPLGPEAFLLTGFSGREELSQGFRYELEMLSDREAAEARDLVGQPIAWCVRAPGAEPRWFHGVVSRLSAGAREVRELRTYRAVVVPHLWYHGRTVRRRVFENHNVPEIVEAVFGIAGQTGHTWALSGSYAPRPLCVQYGESDLQFARRLLEEERIVFFYQHEEERHTLVLADDSLTAESGPGREVVYDPAVAASDHVATWEHRFDSPEADGQDAVSEAVNGSGRCAAFTPGDTFTLRGHDCTGENGTYLLVAVEHAAQDVSLTPHGGGREYANTFTCVPVSVPFRPARVVPRPSARGTLLAEVVEAPGDATPRVRVRFADEGPDRWEDGSCWARVAGAEGEPPPAGREVLVGFVGGDPDRPVLVGGGAAADTGKPLRGGLADDSGNEFLFVADEGRSEVRLHAGKDCRREVENDDAVFVGRDQSVEVRNHRRQTIKEGDETIRLEKGNRTVTLDGGDETIRLEKGSRTLVVDGTDRHQVRRGDRVLEVEAGNALERVQSGNREVHVEKGDDSLQVGQGKRVVVLEVGDDVLTVKAGSQTTRVDLGRSTTEAAQGIELRVGPSRISIEPTGIVIEGLAVKVRGHAHTEVAGLMTQVGADAVLEVKGGATLVG